MIRNPISALQDVTSGFRSVTNAADATANAMSGVGNAANAAAKAIPEIGNAASAASKAIPEIGNAASAAAKAIPEVTNAVSSVADTFNSLMPWGVGIMGIGMVNNLVQTGTFIVGELISFLLSTFIVFSQFTAKKVANLSNAVCNALPYVTAATYTDIWDSFRHVLYQKLQQYDHILVVMQDHYGAQSFSVSQARKSEHFRKERSFVLFAESMSVILSNEGKSLTTLKWPTIYP